MTSHLRSLQRTGGLAGSSMLAADHLACVEILEAVGLATLLGCEG